MVQCKKKQFETENIRIKILPLCIRFPAVSQTSYTIQTQSRHQNSAEAGNACTGLSFDAPGKFASKRVDCCLTAFMDVCEPHWFIQLKQ